MSLSFVTCFKNEAWRLEEWVKFHNFLGVETFILFDDGSSDNTTEVLDRLSKQYKILSFKTDGKGTYSNSSNPNEYGKNGDLHLRLQRTYKKGLEIAKNIGINWAGVFDVDEYVVPINKSDCRRDFYRDYFVDKNYPRIYVHSFDMRGPFSAESKVTKSISSWSKQDKNYGIVNGISGWFKERGKSFVNLDKWNGTCTCAHNISWQECLNEGDNTRLSEDHKKRCLGFPNNIRINHYRNNPLLDSYTENFENAELISRLVDE